MNENEDCPQRLANKHYLKFFNEFYLLMFARDNGRENVLFA